MFTSIFNHFLVKKKDTRESKETKKKKKKERGRCMQEQTFVGNTVNNNKELFFWYLVV